MMSNLSLNRPYLNPVGHIIFTASLHLLLWATSWLLHFSFLVVVYSIFDIEIIYNILCSFRDFPIMVPPSQTIPKHPIPMFWIPKDMGPACMGPAGSHVLGGPWNHLWINSRHGEVAYITMKSSHKPWASGGDPGFFEPSTRAFGTNFWYMST